MKTRTTQNGYLELILGIGLVVTQLCAWPSDQHRAKVVDDVPAILKLEQGSTLDNQTGKAYHDSRVASRLLEHTLSTSNPS